MLNYPNMEISMTEIDTESAYGVYRIVSPNGSCYIGMTAKSFDERWKGHLKGFRLGSTVCAGLRRAFEKYGIEAMTFEVLEDLTGYGDEWILYRERVWWLRHKAWGLNLYNGEPTGRGSVRHTEETRARIGNALRTLPTSAVCAMPLCDTVFEMKRNRRLYCSGICARSAQRSKANKRQNLISKEELSRLYLVQKMSKREIGELLGVHRNTIGNMLLDYDIPRRKIGRGASKQMQM